MQSFESKTCGRCGGGGAFGPRSVAGGRCFGCSGKGFVYTKRGQAAYDFYVASLCKPAGDVVVGDVIRLNGVPGYIPACWITVAEVVIDSTMLAAQGYEALVARCETKDGQRTQIHLGSRETGTTDWSGTVRYSHTGPEKRAKLEAAWAYQETLTKTGTVRKAATR